MEGPIRVQHAADLSFLNNRPSVFRRDGPLQNNALPHGAHAAGRSACPKTASNVGAFSSGVPGMIFSV